MGQFRPSTESPYNTTSWLIFLPSLKVLFVFWSCSVSETAPTRHNETSRMLWVQLLAGPVLWSVHFLISYFLVELSCQTGWSFTLLGLSGLSFILILLTVLALIATALFSLKSYHSWKGIDGNRSLREELRESSRWSEGPVEFMYLTGFLLSILFTVAIIAVGVPVIFLQPCA